MRVSLSADERITIASEHGGTRWAITAQLQSDSPDAQYAVLVSALFGDCGPGARQEALGLLLSKAVLERDSDLSGFVGVRSSSPFHMQPYLVHNFFFPLFRHMLLLSANVLPICQDFWRCNAAPGAVGSGCVRTYGSSERCLWQGGNVHR